MSRKRVVMIGGAGYVASQMLPTFRERYELVLLDVATQNRWGETVDGVQIADLSDSDRSRYEAHFEGADAVVHLARKKREGAPIDHFANEFANLEMSYNVFRAAYEAGVARVVYASSNHAADWYEYNLIHERAMEVLDPYMLPLSDNFYGWGKAATEHMGFLFACGVFGRKMGVVNVRIGSPSELDADLIEKNPRGFKRHLGSYISPRDITQLFGKAIDAPNIDNEHGIPWQVVYGISNNTRAFWSLANARKALGYQPQDDAEVKYADAVRRFLAREDRPGRMGRVGLS